MNTPSALRTLACLALVGSQLLSNVPPALAQQSRNLTLVSHINLHPPANPLSLDTFYSGCAPYIHSDGREYVVQLAPDGASIVRLTDPANPVEVAFFPTKTPWSEARQYGHYIYMTDDTDRDFSVRPNNVGLAIIDMRDPDNPHKVANLQSPIVDAHSIEIDQARGLLYANGEFICTPDFSSCDQGHMKIFSLADPENPTLLATYPTYVHHIHLKGTLGYASLIFEGGGGATDGYCAILDLSDPSNPREISRIVTDWRNQHSTWTSEDGRTLYACNENAENGLTVWDVSNSASPSLLFTDESLAKHIIHQPRVLGSTLYISHYTAGVRLMDIRNPGWPVEFAYYDTYPSTRGEGTFFGAYDVMPFFPSGIFVVSDMQTGLYVFRKDPVNYGIVRGSIRDGVSGVPVGGAVVTVQPSGLTMQSGQDGRYAFAIPTGGSSITVSTYGDVVSTKNVSVALNSDQMLDFTLAPLPAGALSGTVRATNGGAVIPGGEVEILGTPLRAVANSQGVYLIPTVPAGTYDVRAAQPGFAAQRVTLTIPKSKTTKLDFSLGPVLFYDDAETDRGWSLRSPTDTTYSGAWARSVPGGEVNCSVGSAIEPAADHTPDPGSMCFNTGTFHVECFPPATTVTGIVTLTSPILHMGGVSDPRIGYWRWFQTDLPGVSTTAPLTTMLSNDGGTTWITVDTYLTAASAWKFAEIRVTDFIPSPRDVLLRFVVRDWIPFDDIHPEVDIDDIALYSGNGGTGSPAAAIAVSKAPVFAVGAPRPSPSHGPAEVELTLPHETPVHVDVYDLRGRLVRTVVEGAMSAGSNLVRWDGRTEQGAPAASGVYWMAIRAGEERRNLKVVIVR